MATEPLFFEKMRYATLILATSFIIGSIAGPLTPTNHLCSLTCIDNKKFIYDVGKSYIYNYVAETTTKLQRDGAQESNIRIRAKAEFEPITNCEYVLRLRDVFLEDPNSNAPATGAKDFQLALERFPLRFGNLDGKIKSVCPDVDEPLWVVNIKKGILSTFQNSMDNLGKEQSLQETDITGQCLTHYTIEEGTGFTNTVIKKSKDLTGCVGRTDHYTSFQSNSYNPKITSKTTPLVKSDHSCEQTIRKGRLQQSVCKESHRFQPFSEGKGSGVISTNIQRLELIKEEHGKYSDLAAISKRTSLLFEHNYREFGENSDEREAENALRELCQLATDDIRPETPKLFSRLVHTLQELSYEKLMVVYKNVDEICSGNRKARKFLYDAVPLTGTVAGVTLMRDLILNSEISKAEADTWLFMLGFLPRPSKEIIASSMPLLDNPYKFPKGLLAVSALTHSYCKTNPDCGKEVEVKNLVKKLVYHLRRDCQPENDQQKEIILVTLKALGNIGHIENALPILNACYQTTSNPIEVRLAALDAFRRLPCHFKRDSMFESFFNFQEDTEIRIGSYLAIMKCPTEKIINRIKENLGNEELNQVGSFVWTHLTSIQESSDPYKTEIKKIVTNKALQKKFSTDVRKFSRYFEGSFFSDSFKTGALADGSIIFSPKSYLPRSSTLGLTVDVFGESINLFEVGGRVEGFEFFVESFFGPKGYFPDDSIQKILESARDTKSYDANKLDRIAQIFNVKHSSEEEPRGEMFMRIFGSEINFMQFRGFEQLLQRSTDGFNILHELIQLTHKEDSQYTKSFMFLDSSIIVPTSVGLPLNLTVNGTSTVNLKVGARMDLSQLRSKNLLFKMKVQPSASVEIAGSMVLDAFVTRAGLQMVATMHTSTYANGQIMLKKGEILQANIDMPKNQMEVFDIQSKVYMIKGQEVKVHAPLVANQMNLKKCTGQGISKAFGIQLCGEVEFPLVGDEPDAPFFPLAGPISAKIHLLKTDTNLNSYNLEYRWDRKLFTTPESQPYYIRTGRLSLDTPKSTVNRELTAEFVLNEGNGTVDILLVSPFKKLAYSGQFLGEKMFKKIDASIKIDDEEYFALQSDVRIDKAGNNFKLTPSMSVHVGGRPVFGLKGYAFRQEDRKYSMEVIMDHVTSQPVTLNGHLTKSLKEDKFRYDANLSFGSSPLNLFLKWFMQSNSNIVASKGTIEYSWLKSDTKAITFTTKSNRTSDINFGTSYNFDAGFQCTNFPNYNWALSWNTLRADGQMENSFSAFYGLNESNSSKLISLQSNYKREGSLLEHKVVSAIRILYPAANLDATLELAHELRKSSLNTTITLMPKPDKKIALTLGLNKNANQGELIRGLAQLDFYDNQMKLTGNVLQPVAGDFVANVGARWAEDAVATAVVTLKKRGPALTSWGHELSVDLSLPGQDSIVLTGDILLDGVERSIHGEAVVNGQQYRTFAEYHRPSLENVRVSAGAKSMNQEYSASGQFSNTANEQSAITDVKLGNGRRILTDLRLKRDETSTDAKASVSLDADHFPEQQHVAQLNFQKLFSGSSGSVAVKSPIHDFDVGASWNVSAKNSDTLSGHGEVWFSENRLTADGELKAVLRPASRDVDASLTIHTFFDGIRAVDISFDHSDDGSKWNNHAVVRVNDQVMSTWQSHGIFVVKGGRSNIDMVLKLTTPVFEEPIVLSVHHSWTRNEADTVVAFGWSADQPIRVLLAFVDHSTPVKFHKMLSANLTTPYSWIRNVGYAANVILTDKTAVQAEMHWEDKRILADLESSTRLTGDKIDSYSIIQVNTPFENFHTISSVLRFSLDASSLTTAVDFAWDKERVAVEFIGTSQTGSFGKNAMASLHFVSPYYPLDDFLFTVGTNHKQSLSKYDVEVKWASNRAIAAQLEHNVRTSEDFYLKFDIADPYEIFHQFGSEIRYAVTESRFSGKLIGTLHKSTVDASADIQKATNTDRSTSLRAQATIKTPSEDMRNLHVKLAWKNELASHVTQAKIELNDRKLSFIHELRLTDWTNFHHRLNVTLPENVFRIRKIYLSNEQSMEGNTYKHESEFSYQPDQKYFVSAELAATYAPTQNRFSGNVRLQTPQQNFGPFAILATQNTVDKATEYLLTLQYWPGKIIDISATLEANPMTGIGRTKLSSPFPGFESVSVSGSYNLAADKKTVSAAVQWAADKLIEATVKHQMNDRLVDSQVTVVTPFEGYEITNVSLVYNDKGTSKMAKVEVVFAEQMVITSGIGKMDNGKGSLTINVESPFKGFEDFTIVTDFDVSSSDKRATFMTTIDRVEISAFHNIQSNSMDSGITFTSTIQGLERVSLGALFEDVEGEKKSTINIEKGLEFKVHLLANYLMRPQHGHLNIAFTSPIKLLESVRFGSKYQLLLKEKQLMVDLAYKEKAIEFITILKSPSDGKRHVSVSLTIPCPHVGKMSVVGQYDFTGMVKIGEITVAKNEKEANLKWELEMSRANSAIKVTMTTPIEGMEDLQFKGNLNQENKSMNADLYFMRGSKVFEVNIIKSFSPMKGIAKIILNSPIDGYKSISTSVEYEGIHNKRMVKVIFEKEQMKVAVQGVISRDANITEVSFDVITPIPKFERVGLSGKSDTSKPKNFHTVTYTRGDEKYSVTMEILQMPFYLELNLLAKTPTKDTSFYANYNFMNPNALNFDIKILKEQHMAEIKGRFRKQPLMDNAEFVFSFNTNYMRMTSVNVGVMYDSSQPLVKELKLHCNVNGLNNDLVASLNLKKEDLMASLKGTSAYFGWKKFYFTAKRIRTESEAAIIEVTIDINDTPVLINATLIEIDMERSRVTFSMATPYEIYSLVMTVGGKDRRKAFADISFRRGAHEIFSALLNAYMDEHKCDSKIKIRSIFKKLKLFSMAFSGQGGKADANLNFDMNGRNVTVDYKGRFSGGTQMDLIVLSSFDLPFVNTRLVNAHLAFDSMNGSAQASVISEKQNILTATLDRSSNDNTVLQFYTPGTEEVTIRAHGSSARNFLFEIDNRNQRVLRFNSEIHPAFLDLEFSIALISDQPFGFSTRFDDGVAKKSISTKVTRGADNAEFSASLLLTPGELASKFDVSVELKSSLQRWEIVQFEMQVEKSDHLTLTSSLLWAADQRMHLIFKGTPFSGIQCTFTSPFVGYENVNFIAEYVMKDAEYKYHFDGQWSATRVGMLVTYVPGEASVLFSSPFRGFESLSALLRFNKEPYEAALIIQTNPENQFELNANADLGAKKSSWKLSLATPIAGHKNYILEGKYDFTNDQSIRVQVTTDQGKPFETNFQYIKDAGSSKVKLEINTPMEMLKAFSLDAKYDTSKNSTEALVIVGVNGQFSKSVGNVAWSANSLTFLLETNGPPIGYGSISVSGRSRVNGIHRDGELFFKANDNELLAFTTSVECYLPHVCAANLRVRTPIGPVQTLQINARYASDTNETLLAGTIGWNDEGFAMQTESQIKEGGITSSMSTPYIPIKNVRFSFRCVPSSKHFLINSSIAVEGYHGKFHLEAKNRLPTHFEAKLDVATPFPQFESFRSNLVFNAHHDGRLMDAQFLLEMPVEGFEKTEATFQLKNNDFKKTELLVRLSMPELEYSLEGTMENDGFGNWGTLLTLRTPHPGMEFFHFTSRFVYVDSAERSSIITLVLPNDNSLSLRGSYVLKMNNIGFGLSAGCTWLAPYFPLALQGKYGKNGDSARLALAFVTGEIKRVLSWNQDVDAASYSGKAAYEAYSDSENRTSWSVDYVLDLPTPSSGTDVVFTAVCRHQQADLKNELASIAVSLKEDNRVFDAHLSFKHEGSEHSLHTAYKIMDNLVTEASVKLNSPILPDLEARATVNPKEVAMKFFVGKVENSVTFIHKIAASDFEGTLKVNMPTLDIKSLTVIGKLSSQVSNLKGELIVRTSTTIHTVTASLAQSPMEHQFRLNVRTPLGGINHFMVKGHVGMKSERKGEAVVTITFRNKAHKLTVDLEHDDVSIDASFKAESPLLKEQEFTLQVQLSKPGSHRGNGMIKMSTGGVLHKGQFSYASGREQSTADFLLETPLWNVDYILIESKLMRNKHRRLDANLVVETPKTTHSLGFQFHQNSTQKNAHFTAYTPFLTSGQFSVDAKANRNANVNTIEFTIHAANVNHTISFELQKTQLQGTSLLATLKTPLFGINMLSLRANILEISYHKVDTSLELNFREMSHLMNVKAGCSSGKVDYEVVLQSPFLGIGYIAAIGQVEVTDRNRINFNIAFNSQSSRLYSMRGFLQKHPEQGIESQLEMTAPGIEPITISMKLSRLNLLEFNINLSAKTPVGEHGMNVHLMRKDAAIEFLLKLDSPLIHWQSIHISGNVVMKMPLRLEGSFALQTPGKAFRLASNYRKLDTGNVEGDFTIVTPFQILPLLKVNANVGGNKGPGEFDGSLAIYTAEDGHPEAILNVAFDRGTSGSPPNVFVKLQAPMFGYSDVSFNYGSQILADSSHFNFLKFKVNNHVYGYDFIVLRKPGLRDVKIKSFAGMDTLSLKTTIERTTEEYKINFVVETPIKSLENIQYNMRYSNIGSRRYAFQNLIAFARSKFGFNAELDFDDRRNFIGKAIIETSIKGYENVGFKCERKIIDGYFWGTFEQTFSEVVVVKFLVESRHNGSVGSGKLELKTPLRLVKDANAYYGFDNSHENDARANGGLNLNGRNVVQINAVSKYGTKMLEIVNPIQPVTVEYAYVQTGNMVTVGGKYCWDVSSGKAATIGFGAEIISTERGRTVVIRTVHPSQPLRLRFSVESSENRFFHHGTISWNDNAVANSLGYDVLTTNSMDHEGKLSYDVSTSLSLPMRQFELTSHLEKDATMSKYETEFRWDAVRGSDKRMAVAFEHRNLQPGHLATVNFRYPKRNQNFTLRGEFMNNARKADIFKALLEFIYGGTPSEKFTLHSTLSEVNGYNLDVGAKHPASNIDVKMTTTLMNSKEEMKAAMKFDYLDRFEHYSNMEMRSKIIKLNNHIHMMLKSHAQQLDVNAQLRSLHKGYLMQMDSKLNDEEPITVELHLQNTIGPMATFNAVYDPRAKKSITIRAGMQDNKTILIEAHHHDGSVTTEEMSLLMTLNRSREFITRFNWHPGVLKTIEDGFSTITSSVCANIRQFMGKLIRGAFEEYNNKFNSVKESVMKTVRPILSSIHEEMDEFERNSKEFRQSLSQLYLKNELYIGYIYDYVASLDIYNHVCALIAKTTTFVADLHDRAVSSVAGTLRELRKMCETVCAYMTTVVHGRIQDIPYLILHYASQLNSLGSRTINELALSGLKFMKDLIFYWVPPMSKWEIISPEFIHRISKDVATKLQDYVDQFVQSPYYQRLVENLNEMSLSLQSLYNNEYLQLLLKYAQPISEYFEESIATIMEHPYMELVFKAASYYYDLNSWAYDFFKIQDRLKDMLGLLIARSEDIAMYLVQEMILPEYHLPHLKSDVIFDPEKGKLEIRQKLPVVWSSFTELPNIYNSIEYSDLINLKDQMISLPKASMNKLLHAMRSEFSWKHMFPTFRARALLVGNQHYVTFDGRAYEFAGECSYLLAHDFMDRNFTAIVKYSPVEKDHVEKMSFLIIFDGHNIELHPNLTVVVDGQRKELPFSFMHTRIARTHSALTMTNEIKQIWIRYESIHDVFMLELGGFYHGKTAGLFGSYDHEPYDDFKTPAGKTTSNLEEFASSWEIGSATCRSRKNYAHHMATNSYAMQKPCNDIFSEYESLTPCLRRINPGPYKRMCVNDVSIGERPCAAVAAYVMMCQANGIAVTIPDACSECEINGKMVSQGKEVVLEGDSVPQSLDVVFVIDNTWQCSTTFPKLRSILATVSRNMEGAVSAVHLSDVRYAVVGFGVGAPYTPQVITANGNLFGSVANLDLALNNTHFAAGHHHHIAELIEFAADLPFRAGVGKVMIVAPCAEPPEMYKDYAKLADKLKEIDIKMHLTSIHELILNGINKIKASDVMGFDRDLAYTLNSTKRGELVGDKDVRHQMNIPKNTLTQLALNTDGSVFYASKLDNGQPSIATLTAEAFSRRIAQNAAPAPCQNCLCSTGADGMPKTMCTNCYSGELS